MGVVGVRVNVGVKITWYTNTPPRLGYDRTGL